MRQTITVKVRDRRPEDKYHYGPYFKTVTIGAFCPECGERRGEPVLRPFCDDGAWFSVHQWTNPCGHIDSYPDVLREAEALAS